MMYDPASAVDGRPRPLWQYQEASTPRRFLTNGQLLIIGGQDKGAAHDSVEILDPKTMGWTPAARHEPAESGAPGDDTRGWPCAGYGRRFRSPRQPGRNIRSSPGRMEPHREDDYASNRAQDDASAGWNGAGVRWAREPGIPARVYGIVRSGRGFVVAGGIRPRSSLGACDGVSGGRQAADNRRTQQRRMEPDNRRAL